MIITTKGTAEYLLENDNYLLYCHRDPDGDTFGSASALCSALLSLGKKARITCPSVLPSNLEFLNLSSFRTDKVKSLFAVFSHLESLTSLDANFTEKRRNCK